MTALVDQLAADGVHVTLAPDGTLRTRGDRETVARWLPVMKQHRAELAAAITRPGNHAGTEPAASPADDWTPHRVVLANAYHAEWTAVHARERAWQQAHPEAKAPTDFALRSLLASAVNGWNAYTGDRHTLAELEAQLSAPDFADREAMNRPWLALYCWTLWHREDQA